MSEWCPFAIRRDGPAWKIGYGSNRFAPKRGDVKHSAVGYMGGLMSALDGAEQKSWHFSIAYDGTILQHYAASANCWHAGDTDPDGNVSANLDLVGIEHEGGYRPENEPLTPAQLDATIRLSHWLAEQFGYHRFARYPELAEGHQWWLVEHNQVSNSPTRCPSGRIPWDVILDQLNVLSNRDVTLEFRPGANGLHQVGEYLVLYNNGVPIERRGGGAPGWWAKNFGGQWVYLRNDGNGVAYWSLEPGD